MTILELEKQIEQMRLKWIISYCVDTDFKGLGNMSKSDYLALYSCHLIKEQIKKQRGN